jgi:hypothetical protein
LPLAINFFAKDLPFARRLTLGQEPLPGRIFIPAFVEGDGQLGKAPAIRVEQSISWPRLIGYCLLLHKAKLSTAGVFARPKWNCPSKFPVFNYGIVRSPKAVSVRP